MQSAARHATPSHRAPDRLAATAARALQSVESAARAKAPREPRPPRPLDGITATGLAALGVPPTMRMAGRGAASLADLVEAVRAETPWAATPRMDAVPAHGFVSALILAPREELSAVDRRALRQTGVRNVAVLTSGTAAARKLARQRRARAGEHDAAHPAIDVPLHSDAVPPPSDAVPPIDVVLCHERLADMSALDLLQLLRSYPRLLDLPVLVVSSAATREAVLSSIGAGCSGFLGRPYTVDTLDGQLLRARRALASRTAHTVAEGTRMLSDEEFDRALEQFANAATEAADEAEAHFLEGTAHLLREQWDAAITAFNRTLRYNALHAEACLGLSDAWRGKGDMDKSREFRNRAGEIYARARQWRRAQNIFAELLADSPPDTPNPLLAEAARLLRDGRIDDAAAALLAGRELTPGAPLHEHVARACQFTNAPERTAAAVCRALSSADPELGSQLHRRMLGRFGTALRIDVDGHEEPAGLLDRLLGGTVLHDVVTVARHTLKMWRAAGI
ncbi:tetratricopeptide repeat protein [Nitratidesulfovibrio termitidis]|uniref:tetratricopeptide repeat protein n=1 Tax=Nitratidesulfovibrio termitidis TaxID=42252 RepID=UPI000418D37C|nr:response regulator [Nitratidesulfovibrio termitidis]